MKKLLAILLTLAMLFCLAACSSKDESEETEKESTKESADEETKEQETTEEAPTEEAPVEETPAAPEKKVNVAKLERIEDSDDFAVKVIDVDFVSGYYAEGRDLWAASECLDGTLVAIENTTGGEITAVTVWVLATKDGKEASFNELSSPILTIIGQTPTYSSYVKQMTVKDVQMANGESETFGMQCTTSWFDTMNIIVYSYTDANGKEVVNENAYEWINNTLPVEMAY